MNHPAATVLRMLVLLAVALGTGCGGGGPKGAAVGKSTGGKVRFTVKWPARSPSGSRVIPVAADTILFKFTSTGANPVTIGSDADKLARPFGDAGGSSTYTRDLPVGSYTVSARAFSSQDATVPVATGNAPLTIKGGTTAQATLTMGSTVTQLLVSAAASSVAVGGTTTLTATPEDKDRDVILVGDPTVTWTSSDPTVATVDATGLMPTVHALKAGTVTFIATFNEVEPVLGQAPVSSTSVSVTVAGAKYRLIDLGTLSGSKSFAYAVNASGQVAGEFAAATRPARAFLSAAGGGALKDLGTLPGGIDSHAYAVNDAGQVVGSADAVGGTRAFLSGPGGGVLKDLGTLGGYLSLAYAVNATGQVAGYSDTASGAPVHAFLSAAGGGALKDLGTLPGGDESTGNAVNASGQVAGDSNVSAASEVEHAFLSAAGGGVLTDLGTLGGSESHARAVNDAGQVTGYSSTSANAVHAFLSAAGGGALKDLGTLGGDLSEGDAVNSSGQVVGHSTLGAQTSHAFLCTAGGGMQDLNDLLDGSGSNWTVTEATGINDKGWIAATATNSAGQTHAVLLIPAP